MNEITVVGAGLAGLVAARELVLQGHTVHVVEATAQVGGQLARAEIAGIRVDVGALQLDGADDAVATLLARLDDPPALLSGRPRRWWLSTPTGVRPLPGTHWWGIPATPLAADSVAITGRRAAWRGMLDSLLPGPRGASASTLEELVRIRMGADIAERMVAPVVEAQTGRVFESVQLTDAPGVRHRMLQQNSLARAVTSLRLDEPENAECVTIEGGPSRLIDALVVELTRFGVAIELETRVDDVTDEGIVVDGVMRSGPVVLAAPIGHRSTEVATIVTVVIDAERVPVGTRDAGVLAERARPDGVRRVIDLSALWPGVADAQARGTVLRVEGTAALTIAGAVRAICELWGEAGVEEAVLDAHLASWAGSAFPDGNDVSEHPACVIATVGEHVAGAGIARVIRSTIEIVDALAPEPPPSGEGERRV